MRIAKKHKIVVIEDCAQSLGASIGNQKTGLIGSSGIFSFYATKLITSGGQGGMFVSTWAFAPKTHWNDKIGQ